MTHGNDDEVDDSGRALNTDDFHMKDDEFDGQS